MIVSSHFCRTGNTGDLESAPDRHLPIHVGAVVPYGKPIPKCDAVIFGGGALGGGLGRVAELALARVKIAWGVGVSRHGAREPGPALRGLDLYGSREWGQEGAIWAPCASCMSPLFDIGYPITHEAVLYLNADPGIRERYPVSVEGLPVLANDVRFDEAVAFLGSGSIVVTNSYHGAFWATLLGRRVVLVNPYSSKFYGFRHPPAITQCDDWRAAAPAAARYPEALEECRAATVAFYARVQGLIETRAVA